jgi:hypothetical protein
MAAIFLCRPAAGSAYEWTADRDPCLREGPQFLHKWFRDPFREASHLYLEFGKLADPDGVLAFANRYGLLGLHREQPDRLETLSEWLTEASHMGGLITLWDAVNRFDVTWLEENRTRFTKERPYRLPPGQLATMAAHKLCEEVSAKLDSAEVCLQLSIGSDAPPAGGPPVLRQSLEAHTLLGVIYLQFANALSGGSQLRACELCGKWFEVAGGRLAGAHRGDKYTCSAACRVRLSRERPGRALAMREQGKTPREIAEALRVDVNKVRGWLAKRKG